MGTQSPSRPAPADLGRSRLAGLDALRGIAALWVLHYHAVTIVAGQSGLASRGYLAVDFFFMLSGYVMARSYERKIAGGYGVLRFFKDRYRRLWPVMAIGALIGAPMLALELNDPGRFALVALANLFFIPAVAGAVTFPLNAASWSIFAELSANALHGLLLRRWSTAVLAGLAACLLPLLVWAASAYGSLNVGVSDGTLLLGVLRAVFGYTVGVVLWRVWQDEPGIRISPVAAFAAIPVFELLTLSLGFEGWAIDILFVLAVCPLLLAGGLRYRGGRGWAVWLGAISFPLYAVHHPIMHWVKGLGLGVAAGLTLSLALAAYIAYRQQTGARQKPARNTVSDTVGGGIERDGSLRA